MSGKLVFHFGTVNSSKTMSLLSIGFNYQKVGWNVCVVKPALDTRSEMIETRAGIPPRKADICIKPDESFSDYSSMINNADVILVDECQFLTETQVEELRDITIRRDINILCFGLRTDYNNHLFAASKRLFELADEINEVRTICSVCGKRAGFNKRLYKNNECDSLIDPGWDNFEQRCYSCYIKDK